MSDHRISNESSISNDGMQDKRSSWYENDLQLAAELGKSLLERNVDLEAQLLNSQQLCSEQADEIDLLKKQVEVLRNVNESRQRMYEDIDKSCHELEKTNLQLTKDRRCDKETISKLTERVGVLEGKCEELEGLLVERVREAEQRGRKQERQRASSVPSLVERKAALNNDNTDQYRNRYDCLGYPDVFGNAARGKGGSDELSKLRKSFKALQFQLTIEQNRRKAVDSELTAALHDNQNLIAKLNTISLQHTGKAVATTAVETDNDRIVPLVGCCAECRCARQRRSMLEDVDLQTKVTELIEHDLDTLPRGKGQLVRLKNGGSAFGSRESLNMIGLEAEDMTPNLEVCSAILASDITERMNLMSRQDDDDYTQGSKAQGQKNNFSLLGEFEEQYRKLVLRYETLVEAKLLHSKQNTPTDGGGDASSTGRRPQQLSLASQTENRRSLDLHASPLDIMEGHFENGPPEYKRLFKEIFDTLRRSVVFEQEGLASTEAASDSNPAAAGTSKKT